MATIDDNLTNLARLHGQLAGNFVALHSELDRLFDLERQANNVLLQCVQDLSELAGMLDNAEDKA